MCGRFAMPWDPDELAERLGLDTDEDARDVTPSYNIRPGATIAVIRHAKDGADMLSGARWSLIPAWSPTDRLAYPTFNARVETAADRPAFRDAARSGRILVPMLGYYEWDIHRQPHWFHSRNDGILLAAGLLSIWRGMPTCTILTRQAEGRCARVHDRMPVLIPNAHTGAWLDPQTDAHGPA
ncbi:SOS response-associated peptidase [uncultured Bifidobacterium sp.]|uniref:SOS response-associated peptidase n=1 Tax=uncultured Bifidobacterium sp. TaxID=165187 RepID=UPI0025988B44|nr:SOS response-associated peptidase [uncultured Bifidobacterium sp.]